METRDREGWHILIRKEEKVTTFSFPQVWSKGCRFERVFFLLALGESLRRGERFVGILGRLLA